jgi:hypothetical protein
MKWPWDPKLDKIISMLTNIIGREVVIVAALDDLKAQVKALQDEATAIKNSTDTCIARVEAVIAALSAGNVPAADVAQAATDLQGVVDTLKGVGTELDTERP